MSPLRKLTVADVFRIDENPPIMVDLDEDFSAVIECFTSDAEARGIFVADCDNRLLGVITLTNLLDWARIKLGEYFHAPSPDPEETIRLSKLIHASKAGEVMHPESQRAGVKPSDTLGDAMELMIELDIIVLPVIDENNKIIGDLKLSELLAGITPKRGV